MEADTGLARALGLLCADASPQGAIVATDASVASGNLHLKTVETIADAALAGRLRELPAPTIVALHRPSPSLLRALREHPPALLVVTGDVDDEMAAGLARIPECALLGPAATLLVGDGKLLICAPERGGLAELTRELGPQALGLGLAPTPTWLVTWLSNPQALRAVGFVHATALDIRWSQWVRNLEIADATRHLLVPLGIDPPRIDQPRHPTLGAAVAAHALERTSGPVYPSATVLAAILRGPKQDTYSDSDSDTHSASEALRSRWIQARRALPLTGATPGMEAPLPALYDSDAGAAYLAQRTLLRQRRCLKLVQERSEQDFSSADPAGHERSLEVLRGAGEVLSEHESKVVLHGFGIEVTRQAVASSASGAASFAEQIGFPVVLKAVSPDLRRKRELGAVVLDLKTAASVRRAYASIISSVENKAPAAHIDGVLVAEQIEEGLELQCGAVRLDSGEIALYGRPIGLQAPQEQVLVASPLSEIDALLLANAILTRVPVPAMRRRSDPDVRVLAALFLRLDELLQLSEERLLSVELRPIRLVRGDRGYVTLDARIVQRAHLEGL